MTVKPPPSAATEAIELRVERVEQLFDTLDPFPFHERALDAGAEEYIVTWARSLPRNHRLRVIVHLPTIDVNAQRQDEIGSALKNFFSYRASVSAGDLRELFRIGRLSLLIGVVVLTACLLIAETIPAGEAAGTFARIVQQSILILGWVANWRPLEIFLYDWWPIRARRDLYLRLASAQLELRAYQ